MANAPTPYPKIADAAAKLARWLGLPADAALTFQVFSDGKSAVGADVDGLAVNGFAATFAATAAELADAARHYCGEAAFPNLYVTSGLHDPPDTRKAATCRRVLWLTCDADACDWLTTTRSADFPDTDAAKAHLHQLGDEELAGLLEEHRAELQRHLQALGLAPTAVWRSGYGHYALFILEDDVAARDVAACKRLNKDLIAAVNTSAGYRLADPAASDAGTRVVRMVGAYNVKRPDRPLLCRVLAKDGPRHQMAALRALVPATRSAKPQTVHPSQAATATVSPPGERLSDREVALLALDRLRPSRADDYQTWCEVGMALQSVGDDLLPEWIAWSRQSTKFDGEEVCETKWRSFTPDGGLTVAALVEWARTDGDPEFLKPGWRHGHAADVAADGLEPEPADEPFAQDRRCCEPGRFRSDDIGNAERLVALYGDRLRWCKDWQTWLYYDGSRWAQDTGEQALACAKATARSILREAHNAPEEQRSALAKWAVTSATRQKLDAALYVARPDLAVTSTALDADPNLLNCRNGVIDLRTGDLRPHNPSDLVTRRVEAEYHPDADFGPAAEEWNRFLADATGGDAELTAYLQRAAGYTLTGDPNEEVLFFTYGPARTGKSTFLDTLRSLLGDYADSLDFAALLRSRGGSDARPEIAKLQGRRLAVAVEASGRRDFEAELLKWLTGGETISARAMYRNPVSWRPQFTLWLAANDRPKVAHDDSAVWRRMRVIPLVHQVPPERVDRDLKRRLREQCADAVLAWCVRGCLAWQSEGLDTCSAVEEATGSYQAAMDPLADWLDEHCAIDPTHNWFTPTEELFRDFREWCDQAAERMTLTQNQFADHLASHGPVSARRRIGAQKRRGFDGIRLTRQAELDLDGAECRSSGPALDPLPERLGPGGPPVTGYFPQETLRENFRESAGPPGPHSSQSGVGAGPPPGPGAAQAAHPGEGDDDPFAPDFVSPRGCSVEERE